MSTVRQSHISHRGNVFDVEVITQPDDRGRSVRREIVRHPGAVLVVPRLPDGRLVLIRNHRIAVDESLLEFPAGKLEPGEPPIDAAARELEEETGYRAARIEPLAEFFTSPGFSDERMHAFVADRLTEVGQRLEAGEQIQVETFSGAQVLAMIDNGRIHDGKTIAAMLFWHRRHGQQHP